MRSSPHVRFVAAIVAISRCTFAGIAGCRNPFRCQRISVSGFTKTSNWRQETKRDKAARTMRGASSARRGLTLRSWYNANCL